MTFKQAKPYLNSDPTYEAWKLEYIRKNPPEDISDSDPTYEAWKLLRFWLFVEVFSPIPILPMRHGNKSTPKGQRREFAHSDPTYEAWKQKISF